MKEWFTNAEFGDLLIPEFPSTEQGVSAWVKRHNIDVRFPNKVRQRRGNGGGVERHISVLSKPARDSLLNRAVESVAANVPATDDTRSTRPAISAKNTAALTAWQRDVMEARAAILGWVDRNAALFGKEPIIRKLVALSKAGQLPEDLRALVIRANAKSGQRSGNPKATIGRASIFNWFAERANHGVAGLAPGIERSDAFEIPDWAPALVEIWRDPNKPALSDVLRRLPERLPGEVAMPSYDQARRFIGKLSPVTLNKGRLGPQALKSLKAFTRRDTSELWPTAVYSSDGHTFKATVEHPFHGQPFRPEITAVIDIAIELAALQFVDRPITKALVDSILDTCNGFIRTLIGRGALYPGSYAYYNPAKNEATELAAGHLVISRKYMAPPPAERITFENEIDITLVTTIAA